MNPQVPTVVLDVDGVLADTRHRLHHLRSWKDWSGFFAAAGQDPVHPQGLAVATEAAARGAALVYLSGRPEHTRAATVAWLAGAGAPAGQVLMRPEGDRRPAHLVKVAALQALAAAGHRLDVLVDDDPDVVAAVRAARPPLVREVLLADWQPRDAVLRDAQERRGRT